MSIRRNHFRTTMTLALLLMMLPLYSQTNGGDLLNEVPLSALPAEMSFEDYRDMNRRLTIGMALASVPLPGIVHFYAGERKTGTILLGAGIGSIVSIIAGASAIKDGDYEVSDFPLLIINEGSDSERRYEKIPIAITGVDTTFKLDEIYRKGDPGVGGLLILIGATVLISDVAYDIIHGLYTIEKKRDAVRFKYGKMISSVTIEPQLGLHGRSLGLRLSFAL